MKTETLTREGLREAVKASAGRDADMPLSEEEARAWALMVEEGRKLRAKTLARQAERDAKKPEWLRKLSKKNTMEEIPNRVKRWLVCRMAGFSFRKAGEMSGASWLEMQEAKAHSDEFRNALAAQEENSRQLMRAKAQSVVEQSQEEDAKVSIAQTQVSMRILESLDREHFGSDVGPSVADEVQRQLGGGGFVINLVGDAAKVAEAVPAKRPGKALVFTDV